MPEDRFRFRRLDQRCSDPGKRGIDTPTAGAHQDKNQRRLLPVRGAARGTPEHPAA